MCQDIPIPLAVVERDPREHRNTMLTTEVPLKFNPVKLGRRGLVEAEMVVIDPQTDGFFM